jgi:hypothetical protein
MPVRTSLRTLVAVAVIVIVLALAGGFALDAKGFATHLLAEVVGVLASVLLAVFVVDVLVEREQARRWDLVAVETTTALRFAIIRAGLDVYLMLPAPRPTTADPYTMGLGEHGELTAALRSLADAVRETQDLGHLSDAVGGLRPHLALVRDGVMPRLLAIGQHELVARLAALEGSFQDLEHAAWLNERFSGLPAPGRDLANVIDALAGVAELVDIGEPI